MLNSPVHDREYGDGSVEQRICDLEWQVDIAEGRTGRQGAVLVLAVAVLAWLIWTLPRNLLGGGAGA